MAAADDAVVAFADFWRLVDFLVEQEPFRQNTFLIIDKMVELEWRRPTTGLVDEVLHSIFFLGKINTLPFSPQDILSDDLLLNTFKDQYPRPFDLYSSEVPRRSPFSCVLDMFVNEHGRNNEGAIRQQLKDFIRTLRGDNKKKPLVSTAICVSQSNPPGSDRYYGVSISANSPLARKILIGASCLRNWERYVPDAVMTFYPGVNENKYFDGTIRVPENVRCETFDLYDGSLKPPCKACRELFGLTGGATEDINKNVPHGNCAEAESLSNLFRRETTVRDQAKPRSEKYTEVNRSKAEESVRKMLQIFLSSPNVFTRWRDGFYTPQ
ncbi:uncharacterized protein LOC120563473 [Perca fluviatilis]|uniref:uncharacterized protein LOC120563473 n=1 Tax=Perca fluviatilis TaxID=8168 RepID=UPI001965F515|nr:uncharacterized protein LOC120563473 [Perca fluviatilis]